MDTRVTSVWQRVVQIPTRALQKRYIRLTGAEKAQAAQVQQEYKRLLALKILASDFEDDRYAAPPAVQQMWQQHILDTLVYAEHCKALCGRLLHHNPDAGEDMQQHARRCHRALAAYRQHFGEEPPALIWDYGPIPSPSLDEAAADAPSPKRRRAGAAASLNLSIQAPGLPLRSLVVTSDDTVQQVFSAYVAASGAMHLVPGRNAAPQTTRCARAAGGRTPRLPCSSTRPRREGRPRARTNVPRAAPAG